MEQEQMLSTSNKTSIFLRDSVNFLFSKRDFWRPWNWTYISGQDPTEALFSDDPKQGYDRFQVLNEQVLPVFPTFWIDAVSTVNYGKVILEHKATCSLHLKKMIFGSFFC